MSKVLTASDKVIKSRGIYNALDTDFLVGVLNSPWFNRIWTVQELVLSQEASVLCGTKCISWESFNACILWLECYESIFAARHDPKTTSNPATFNVYLACYIGYRTFCDSLPKDTETAEPVRRMTETPKDVRSKKATDPRDKVYGVYGLLENQGLPTVDYDRAVRDVYTDITIASIKGKDSLRVLHGACLPRLVYGLPSWVSDWSNASLYQPLDFSHRTPRSPTCKFDGYKLSVARIFIEKVGDIAHSTSISTANYR
jgi:hypothetical protein